MATIIQPYNPWLETLAVNTLVPMISGALERQRQRDENRKQNALKGEVLKQLGELQGMADAQQGGALQSLPEPDGYNSNAWAQAYHKQEKPLGQFDAGIADLLPPTMQTQTQPKAVTPADIQRAIVQNLANPRFSHLDPDAVQKYFAPYIQASEAARQEGFRNEAMNNYRNASTPLEQRNAVMDYVIRGNLPESLGNMVQGQYIADRPQFTPVNTGGEYVLGSVDPTTGSYNEQSRMPMTLTPQQVQAGQQWQDTFDYTKAKDIRDFDENQRRFDIERNDRRTDADRNYQLQKRGQPTITRMEDGRRIATYPDGSEITLTPDSVGLNSVEKAKVAQLETQRQGLIAQQTELQKALAQAQQAGNTKEVQSLTAALDNVNAAIKKIDDEANKMFESKLNPPRNMAQPSTDLWTPDDNNDPSAYDLGSHMTGGAKGISSSFKKIRIKPDGSTRLHYGVDYLTPNGTEILVPDVGTPLTVTRVRNQPDGYGHYARLSGRVNGHRIELTVAHMQPGVNVKEGDVVNAGDLIGLSGNSGNSSGPNGGYHMHLECKIDGEYVDPTQARKIIAGWQPEAAQGDKLPAFIGPDVNGNQRVITLGEFNELVRKAEAGQLPGAPNVRTAEDVRQWLESKGYKQSGAGSASQTTENEQQEQATQAQSQLTPQQEAFTAMRQEIDKNKGNNVVGLPLPMAIYRPNYPALPVGPALPAGNTNLPATIPNGSNLPAVPVSGAVPVVGGATRSIASRIGIPAGLAVLSDMIWPKPAGETPGELEALRQGQQTQSQPIPADTSAGATTATSASTAPSGSSYFDSITGLFGATPAYAEPTEQYVNDVPSIDMGTAPQAGVASADNTPVDPTGFHDNAPAPSRKGRTSYAALKDVIDGAAQRHGIDNELIQAIIEVESTWKPKARSNAGAMGLMQLMPATARSLGVRNAYDPAQNIEGGSKYIAQLISRYGGDVNKALMAYNCGPGNVSKGRIPQRSRSYAKDVMNIYNRLKGQRQSTLPPADTNLLPTESAPAQQRTSDGKGISWVDTNTNQPLQSASGEVFTDELYNKWAEMIDAGEYKDMGLNSRADLDKWLESKGMRRVRPSVDRGLARLNNANTTNVPADVYDADIAPEPPNPQTSPASFPAPSFTDELNGTRAQDLQGMLDDLNGIGRGEHPGWSAAFHNIFGSPVINFGR